MARPARANANPAPLAGAARPVKATKPPKVGAARKSSGRKKDASTGGGKRGPDTRDYGTIPD